MDITQLETLIEEGNQEEIIALLTQNRQLARVKTSHGVSPLLLAAYYKKPEIAIVIAGFMKNLTIHEACAIGDTETVNTLIAVRTDLVNAFADDGFTPLGLACFFTHEELTATLLSAGAEVNIPANNGFNVFPIHSAVAANSLNIAKLLLDAGANPNVKQVAGVTPLHSAAEHGNIDLIILLLEHGAETNVRMEGGKLPADLAADKGFEEIAEILAD